MDKKEKYQDLIDHVMDYVGGKENVTFFTHCITRLRFNVKDKSLVQTENIEKLSNILGCQWQNDQLQIVVGQKVDAVYQKLCQKYGLNIEEKIDENLDTAVNRRKFSPAVIIDGITGCIIPLLPILLGVGLIKVVLLIATMCGILETADSTYIVLNFAADAGFYFLPVFVGATAAKKFNTSQALGMLVGAMLIHPTFISSVASGTPLSIFGLPIYSATYTSSFFSAMLAVFVLSYVEKFFKKISPEFLSAIIVPLGTMIVMIPLTFCLVAPLGSFIGVYLSKAIIWLYNTTGFLGVAVFASIRPFLVMTGMHTAFTPYLLNSLATVGYEPFYSVGAFIANLDQGASCLGVAVKTKDKNIRSTAFTSAITALIGGITEPAMYGINLKYKTPMIAATIGSFAGAAYAGIMHVYMWTFAASGGIFGITAYISEDPMSLINMIIGVAIGLIVTFVLTIILYKEEKKN